jgi:energy-coupling factor transport system permease protein
VGALFDSILIGQYYPTDSPLHKLDPRTKLLGTLAFSVLLFWVTGWAPLGLCLGFVLGLIGLSRVPYRLVLRGMRPMLWLLLMALAFNLFAFEGEVLWRWGTLQITREGLMAAGQVGLRLLALLLGATLLTLTTAPMPLTDGLERLLRPFERVGLPAGDLALMMTIALRFIPTLLEEAQRIQRAQAARGAVFGGRGLIARIKALLPIVVPLFASAIRRAEELATAMEARAFRSAGGRTRFRPLRFTWRDPVAAGVLALFMAGVWWLQWMLR